MRKVLDALRSLPYHSLPTLVFTTLIGFNFLVFILLAHATLGFTYQAEWAEGTLTAISNYLHQGYVPLHTDHEPYIALFYPPLLTGLVAILGQTPEQMLTIGRLLAMGALLATIPTIYLICQELKLEKRISLLCAFMSITLIIPRTWAVTYREDILAYLFSLLAVLFFLRMYDKKGKWWLPTVVMLTLALWTKQMAFSAGLAICIYLLLNSRYKDCSKLAIAWIILTVAAAIPGLMAFGPDFIRSFTTESWAPMSWWRLSPLLKYVLWTSLCLFCLAELGLVAAWRTAGKARLIGIYFTISLMVGIILSSKIGSSTNYYMEAMLVICILVGLALQRWSKIKVRAIVLSLVATQMVCALILPVSYENYKFPQPSMKTYQADIASRIKNDNYVLSDDSSLMVMLNKEPKYEALVNTILAIEGKIDQTPLINDIRNQKFDHIVILQQNPFTYTWIEGKGTPREYRKWTPEMQQAIVENYRIETTYGIDNPIPWEIYNYYLLCPKHGEE